MKKNYYYVREKINSTISTLTVGSGDVRSRLKEAYSEFHTLKPEDFPDELQGDWKWVLQNLTKKGPVLWDGHWKGKLRIGSVENTMSLIQNKTGSKIARKILYLHEKLNESKYFQ